MVKLFGFSTSIVGKFTRNKKSVDPNRKVLHTVYIENKGSILVNISAIALASAIVIAYTRSCTLAAGLLSRDDGVYALL